MTLATVDAAGRPVRAHRAAEGRSTRAASSFTRTTTAARDASLPAIRASRCCFSGPSSSGRFASKVTASSGERGRIRCLLLRAPARIAVGAWASPQSAPIPDRAWLEAQVAARRGAFLRQDVPRPPNWGGCASRRTASNSGRDANRGCTIGSSGRATAGHWTIQRLAP